MNVAFPALVTFALALPGMIFWQTVRHGSSDDPVLKGSAIESMAFSLPIACILHFVWYWLTTGIGLLVGLRVDLQSVVFLLIGRFGDKDEHLASAVSSVTDYSFCVFLYSLSLCGVAFWFGREVHRYAIRRGSAIPHFVDFGQWWYRLATAHDEPATPVLISRKDGDSLVQYLGVVDDFDINEDGELTRVLLRGCHVFVNDVETEYYESVFVHCAFTDTIALIPAPPTDDAAEPAPQTDDDGPFSQRTPRTPR